MPGCAWYPRNWHTGEKLPLNVPWHQDTSRLSRSLMSGVAGIKLSLIHPNLESIRIQRDGLYIVLSNISEYILCMYIYIIYIFIYHIHVTVNDWSTDIHNQKIQTEHTFKTTSIDMSFNFTYRCLLLALFQLILDLKALNKAFGKLSQAESWSKSSYWVLYFWKIYNEVIQITAVKSTWEQ